LQYVRIALHAKQRRKTGKSVKDFRLLRSRDSFLYFSFFVDSSFSLLQSIIHQLSHGLGSPLPSKSIHNHGHKSSSAHRCCDGRGPMSKVITGRRRTDVFRQSVDNRSLANLHASWTQASQDLTRSCYMTASTGKRFDFGSTSHGKRQAQRIPSSARPK
jgi:hypothetical protein